jgi:hypothetical protein
MTLIMTPIMHNTSTPYPGQNFFETTSKRKDLAIHSDGDEDKELANLSIPFPWKLHEVLDAAENEDFEDVISWLPDHHSFKVHNTDAFVHYVMPAYFHQTKYKSFQRQCKFVSVGIYSTIRIRGSKNPSSI